MLQVIVAQPAACNFVVPIFAGLFTEVQACDATGDPSMPRSLSHKKYT
jgi:hypothetical protein